MKTRLLLLTLSLLGLFACQNQFYSSEDFAKVEKIDAHFHIYTDYNSSVSQAMEDHFRLLAINTNSESCGAVGENHQIARSLKEVHPREIEFSATFCLDGWDEPGWAETTIRWLDSCIADGAVAVKVWKNIGMVYRDRDSNLVMIDDPRFDPVFSWLAGKKIPLVGHLGEPRNCWLPFEQMTTRNDSSYFSRHPEYHMFRHPEMPSYEEQLAARDRMLEKNPGLVFIGCHLASLEWSVDELAHWLDRFPNTAVDLAARMGQLFFQTRDDREKVRQFFISYQDRLLYGTDIIDSGSSKPENFRKRIHDTWTSDWRYLTTDETLTRPLINGEFRGLKLPKTVVDKIYSQNARKWYRAFP